MEKLKIANLATDEGEALETYWQAATRVTCP